MKIGVVIQARMGSTRLPGKVLFQLEEKSVLEHVVNRCQQIELANEIIVATTDHKQDDVIEKVCEKLNVKCFRGNEHNVLKRYYDCATMYQTDVIVRITSDCPLIDPWLSNQVIKQFFSNDNIDYCSNTLERTFPRGLDTEVFSFNALEKAYIHGSTESDLEHVTLYIYRNPDKFKLSSIISKADFSNHRWTLDTPEDWELIQEIYSALYKKNPLFSWQDVLLFLNNNPDLLKINNFIQQKNI